MSQRPSIVWFQQDLRLDDNPALRAATARGGPIVPLFIWAPEEEGGWAGGGASRWWLHQSLKSLDKELQIHGSRLMFRKGKSLHTLKSILNETGADAVFWNRRYEPAAVERDKHIRDELRDIGVATQCFNAGLLFEPEKALNKQGKPYQVFTPFWKACLCLPPPQKPDPASSRLPFLSHSPMTLRLEELKLEPEVDWAAGIRAAWSPGSKGAKKELNRFLNNAIASYQNDCDRPDLAGTSRLSPHLHFGEISPRRVWHAVWERAASKKKSKLAQAAETYLRKLIWREFARQLLFYFPHTVEKPLRPEFAGFPWKSDPDAFEAWQKGRTGYPIVDAGMRQLWITGWMHNRVRMITASFLVKDLLISWRAGAKWFWDTLIDADLANNILGWQWTAGCGADAAPYFRIFNPVKQGEKFDPNGNYIRRWVPELKHLPKKWIHKPWQAPSQVLANAGIALGKHYPEPIVSHAAASRRALKAFADLMKEKRKLMR